MGLFVFRRISWLVIQKVNKENASRTACVLPGWLVAVAIEAAG
jgi:hypothetical protein